MWEQDFYDLRERRGLMQYQEHKKLDGSQVSDKYISRHLSVKYSRCVVMSLEMRSH